MRKIVGQNVGKYGKTVRKIKGQNVEKIVGESCGENYGKN